MSRLHLVWAAALPCAVAAVAVARAAAAVEQPSTLPPCEMVDVVLVDAVDSARAKAGDAFRFRTVADTAAAPSHPAVPKDTVGYGLVMGAHHGQRGGRAGHLLVDARFFLLADGAQIPATFIPRTRYDALVMDGSAADAPGYIGMIPFASVMTGAYNTLHYGHEVVFASGTRFKVLIGDDLALAKCHLTIDEAHGPTPKPTTPSSPATDATPPAAPATATPVASPTPMPSPAPTPSPKGH